MTAVIGAGSGVIALAGLFDDEAAAGVATSGGILLGLIVGIAVLCVVYGQMSSGRRRLIVTSVIASVLIYFPLLAIGLDGGHDEVLALSGVAPVVTTALVAWLIARSKA